MKRVNNKKFKHIAIFAVIILLLLISLIPFIITVKALDDWNVIYSLDVKFTYDFIEYHGKLYAGNDGAEILVFDGSTWLLNFTGDGDAIHCFAIYNDKLYAGQGYGTNMGDIYVLDNNSWLKCWDSDYPRVCSLATYNGKLYAGMGQTTSGLGDVIVYDGDNWNLSFDGAKTRICCLCVYDGKLYAGQGEQNAGDGDIYIFDGSSWTLNWDTSYGFIRSMCVYKNKLYCGTGWDYNGDVWDYDGSNWIKSLDTPSRMIIALKEYHNKLYACSGNIIDLGKIYVFDNNNWNYSYNGSNSHTMGFYSLGVYNETLYSGEGYENPYNGSILSLYTQLPVLEFISIDSGINGTRIFSLTPVFVWTKMLTASKYYLQIATDSAFNNLVVNIPNINEQNYPSEYNENEDNVSFILPILNKLTTDGIYYCRVGYI